MKYYYNYFYRVLFAVIAIIYARCFIYAIDIIVNLYYLIFVHNSKVNENLTALHKAATTNKWIDKITFLTGIYEYKHDGIKGFPDWNIRCKRVAALKDFKDDCDGFAMIASWVVPGGERISILPYDLSQYKRMHVVYVYRDYVFSSGSIHRMSLDEYLSFYYKDTPVFLLRHY